VLLPAEEDDEIEFECKTKETTDEDEETEIEIKDKIKFQVKIDKDEGLKVKVKYEQEIETQETETETETQYEVKFDRVIEYRKAGAALSDTGSSDADMAYEWDRDTIVQEMPMINWRGFSAIVEEENGLSIFSISTQDNTATFIFTIARDDSVNSSVTANKMEIDFELTNFPWTADDTFVALLCSVESEREVELEVNEDDSGDEAGSSATTSRKTKDVKINFAGAVDTIGFTPFGEFDWADNAEVRVMGNSTDVTQTASTTRMGNSTNVTTAEIATIRVVATSPADASSDAIAFSFVGSAAHMAADIYWDPSAGVGYEAGSGAAGDGSGAAGDGSGAAGDGSGAAGDGSGASALSFMGAASLGFVALVSMMM
jgi:hypothetical protein